MISKIEYNKVVVYLLAHLRDLDSSLKSPRQANHLACQINGNNTPKLDIVFDCNAESASQRPRKQTKLIYI